MAAQRALPATRASLPFETTESRHREYIMFGVIARTPSRLGMFAFAVAAGLSGGASAQPATTFTADFAAMATYRDLAAQGTGKIAVLLPETTTSARYVAFDEPYIRRALEAVGLTANDYIITNAGGDEAVELTQ